MDIAKKFGATVRQYRSDAGKTLRQLADQANCTYGYIGRIERGNVPGPPSEKSTRELCSALNIAPDHLLGLREVWMSNLDVNKEVNKPGTKKPDGLAGDPQKFLAYLDMAIEQLEEDQEEIARRLVILRNTRQVLVKEVESQKTPED